MREEMLICFVGHDEATLNAASRSVLGTGQASNVVLEELKVYRADAAGYFNTTKAGRQHDYRDSCRQQDEEFREFLDLAYERKDNNNSHNSQIHASFLRDRNPQ